MKTVHLSPGGRLHILRILLILICMPLAASAQTALQTSHIEANVPPADAFHTFLQRDLLAFFKEERNLAATRVELTLLRDVPTQSGVAFPKYYLWVTAFAGTELVAEGAVRVAAIERQSFEVLQYMSKAEVKESPAEVGRIFPAPLVPRILALAHGQ